ncbi:GntR family transcriptional regulator [Streptococcus hyointestinalis]|uniref:GntR family transcriptional regulator n=1 Tax=Streptococcus hyointestinalis TaxID=1337 RepID=A0A380K9G8_9STRE|nr:GntR family transcriptional regulator [Streptococcus hyointestinalis]MCI6872283.1 GntR family transcriptional regulator [Streptococcus hyointestinalis]MDD6383925.1 GntR family transcriptional regulator [Streptococcus hyointestinalis]MDD7355615.1 GntR family transcriptional regulator [Streptococcus hyointestinalis]MDY4553389.1 GntR family transcriptional regulator [Streptococcus hyointestinalis]SUN61735.1 GntR family transcriptional regulator [Streptococcus hyointestinalis]
MAWTFDEKLPIYAQIAQHIKLKIISQEIKTGEKLPTVRDYAQEAGVNPNTMQRAFTELEREGMVYSKRTSGRFVTEDEALIAKVRKEVAETELAQFVKKMTSIGFEQNDIVPILEDYIKGE